jgi:N-acetylglucosamine kinase-like BadF-type ATPase
MLDKLAKLVPANANQNNLHKLQILENTVLYIEEIRQIHAEQSNEYMVINQNQGSSGPNIGLISPPITQDPF